MSLLKRYCDRWNIKYCVDFEYGVNCYYVDLNGLSNRQINLLKWFMGKDGFKILVVGFDRIYFDVSEGVNFSVC